MKGNPTKASEHFQPDQQVTTPKSPDSIPNSKLIFMFIPRPNSKDSLSLFPTLQNTQNLQSNEYLYSLYSDQSLLNEPRLTLRSRLTDEFNTEDIQTLPQYESIDENAPTIQDEESIMCVNCFECVDIAYVDHHSEMCTREVKSPKRIRSKLRETVFEIRDRRLDCNEKYSLPLILLEEIGKKVAEDGNVRDIQDFAEVFDRLNAVIREYSHLLLILRLSQRVSALCEALSTSSDPPFPKNPSSPLPKDSFASLLSDLDCLPNGRTSPTNTPEALEKFFYTQCLKHKSSLPTSHPNRHLSIFSLYQTCLASHTPTHLWPFFIQKSYNSN